MPKYINNYNKSLARSHKIQTYIASLDLQPSREEQEESKVMLTSHQETFLFPKPTLSYYIFSS